MQGTIVVVLSSPHSLGRVGPESLQDWYRGAVLANSFAVRIPNSELLVLSNVTRDGVSEASQYLRVLNQIDLKTPLRIIREGRDTSEKIVHLFKYAKKEWKDIIIVSSFLNYLWVQLLIWRNPLSREVLYKHYAVWGIPRICVRK